MRCSSEGPVTAGDLLTLEELGHLRRTSTWRGAWLVLHAWGIIADAVALRRTGDAITCTTGTPRPRRIRTWRSRRACRSRAVGWRGRC